MLHELLDLNAPLPPSHPPTLPLSQTNNRDVHPTAMPVSQALLGYLELTSEMTLHDVRRMLHELLDSNITP
jgi:hypothetical protein